MKKIYLYMLTAALVLVSSCDREEEGLNPPLHPGDEMRDVTIVADMPGTRSLIDGNQVMWENGDMLSLVFPHTSEAPYISVFTTEDNAAPSTQATFAGEVPSGVTSAAGYAHTGYGVYPETAVKEDGSVAFLLPAEQKVREDGSFADGLNLASATVSLDDLVSKESASANFRNALSIIRFTLDNDVTSMTLTGTSPLAGQAPLTLIIDESDAECGRLVVESDGEWSDGQASVTLKPADGQECFKAGVIYNLLVWPGTHTSLTAAIDYKEQEDISKTVETEVTFLPSKFYTLDFNLVSDTLVSEIEEGLNNLVDGLTEVENRLGLSEEEEQKLAVLMSQIQSVALVTEYLDNAVYAPYATLSSSVLKKEIELNYIVRPASVAAELVETFPEALSAQVYYKNGTLGFTKLAVNSATIDGDVMTVKVEASGISDDLYRGKSEAHLALEISDGNTELLSDFAKLVPQVQSAISVNYSKDVPAISGASVSIPFSYSLATEGVHSFSCSSNGYVRDNGGTGYFIVNISTATPVEQQTAQLVLTAGGVDYVQDFTFVEGGKLELTTDGPVDHIGGEVVVTVSRNDFASGPLTMTSGSDWCTQNNMIFSCSANSATSSRTATADYKVTYLGLTYTKTVSIVQNGTSTPLQRSYYSDGSKVMLNTASAGYTPLNIVILGDGFQKKDLSKGGRFERSARSAMDSFFGIEPFTTYKNRFNVYMVTYESADEGIDINSTGVTKNTYFDAWCTGSGNTAANCSNDKVINVVKNVLGLSSDAQYYRTIAIVLANTTENVGSCAYPVRTTIGTDTVGDGYASFAIATLAAYSTGTNGLIKHEAGGHAFGRLGDEYDTGSANRTHADLDDSHSKGFYLNLSYTTGSSCPWYSLNGYDGTGFYEGAWGCSSGYFRPSQSSIMLNNQGEFNAPSRRAIHRRIILQSQGGSYSDATFMTYDSKNL